AEAGAPEVVTIPLNMGADYLGRSGLGDDLNMVECDQHTMRSLAYENIYVLGDTGTLQTSKAGSVAHFSVEVFVHNFVAAWQGKDTPEHPFDGHSNCFVETGHGKAMLLDFNYQTQPLTGVFPLPGVGPMKLLGESRINHMGKLGFRWVYWNLLLPGRPIPLAADMSLRGKKAADASPAAPVAPAAVAAEPSAAETAATAPDDGAPSDHPIIPNF
ncbi:MAG: NAD(P)/FAD-dependent oxidoreductase, partial [Micrococcales bacterium]|nr:NAD(P)/FAD-dependent oxidoreductase [Micrococcales bacterium]